MTPSYFRLIPTLHLDTSKQLFIQPVNIIIIITPFDSYS